MALLLDAALGTSMSELLRVVIAVARQTAEFKSNLETLKNTLESVKIIFDKIEERSRILNRPQEETYEFINQLRRGVDVVNKCTTISPWKKYSYSKKLVKLDKSIDKFFDIQVQGLVAVNTLSNGVGIQEMNGKIDFMFKCLNISYRYVSQKISLNQQHEPLHIENCASSSLNGCSPWKGFPVLPDGVAGVDKPLKDLDKMAVSVRDKEPPTIISSVGKGITELLQVVASVVKKNMKFQSNLNTLRGTLETVKPISNDIDKLNIVLNGSEEETYQFLLQINHGVQGFMVVNSLRNGVGITERYDVDKFDFTLTVRGFPESVVGFDEQLKDIKGMLLHDKEPVTVISAPGGSGKTTLAIKLCRDPEIQRIFGKNILFVTVSEPANITVIVEKILKWQLPDFQNDDDAIKCLECFLKLLGPSPILLVLDDVWLNMESLMENLTFTLPNYKILVTSRFCSPRFSHVYNLKSVDDQHAITLFSRAALPEDESCKITKEIVEKSLYGDPGVVWSHEEKKSSDGKSVYDTNRVLLDRLPTSLDAFEEMKDSSLKDCYMDLRSFHEDQRTTTTFMDFCAEQYSLDHKDMDTRTNLDELSFSDLLDLVWTRTPSTINIYLHHGDLPPIAKIQGKLKSTNADKKKSKIIERNRPKLKVRRMGASRIRKDLQGVVITEPSISQLIPSQASQRNATWTRGKGKEKVVYEPEKKAYIPKGGNYYLDSDESRRLLQELRRPLFNSAVFTPTPGPAQRPPTNGTSGASNQWNSQCRPPPTPQPMQPAESKQPSKSN